MKRFLSVFLVLTLFLTSCGKKQKLAEPQERGQGSEKIVAAWLNYNEIGELVKTSPNEKSLENIVRVKMLKLKEYSVNTLFLHTRAFDDCFYASNIFPPSKYCSDGNGSLKFDVLKTFIKIGREENIKIHAWINPYRISNDNDTSKLIDGFLPKIWYDNIENQRLIVCENGIFYNPASLDVQKHIIDGIRELLSNYDVEGIHFDDYFYPETSPDIDSSFYNDYVNSGGHLTLGEYRRQCVNSLISGVYSVIKSYDKNIIFSISPSGGINDNLNSYFADVRLWTSGTGYIDWIIPQIYYGFDNEKYPFKNTVDDWLSMMNGKVEILIGLPLYKIGAADNYAGTGKAEWTENCDVISQQILYINSDARISGFSFYSVSMLFSETLSEKQKTELQNIKNVLK